MGYSLLIADDEEIIRKGFLGRLEMLQMMPAAVYEAEDGCRALQIIQEVKPEVVVTDIRMPDMDGLELIRQVRERKLETEFIILSGHAEFSYAEQAIQMGVNAYLLKPISNEELKNVLDGVLEKLDEKKRIFQVIASHEQVVRKKQSLDVEKELNEIFHSQEKRQAGRTLEGGAKYITAVINIDGHTYETNHFHYRDIELIKFTIRNVFEEMHFPGKKQIVDNMANLNQMIAVLWADDEKELHREARYFLLRLIQMEGQKMSISLTVGGSSVKDEISRASYKEACDAFLQRMVSGIGDVYFYQNITAMSRETFPREELELLGRYIERADMENVEVILTEIFSRERMGTAVTDYIRVVWIRLINMLLRVSDHDETAADFDKSILDSTVIDHFNDVEELIQYVCTLIIDFVKPGSGVNARSQNKIKLAVQYIRENYFRDLSITDLAYEYAMSPNYFSTSFKKETGTTIVNYIKRLRLERACELLKNTEKSVVEISGLIGYTDSQYFFRVFKKEYGVTPLQYRKNNQ